MNDPRPNQNEPLTREQIWLAIDGQRGRNAALAASLSVDDWARSSLCAGWTVKHVAAHLAWHRSVTSLGGMPGVVASLIRARGDLNTANHDIAVAWADDRTTAMLTDELRALVGHHHTVIGSTLHNLLIDSLVHHHDIALAVGRPLDTNDPAAAAEAASRVWSLPKRFTMPVTRRLAGYGWRATDTEWERGSGSFVEGPIVAILCALTGRQAAFDHLTGPGVAAARAIVDAPPA